MGISVSERASAADLREPNPLALDGLDTILGLHIGVANTMILQHFHGTMSEIALTPKQTSTLWLVLANPGASQARIARFFRIERATMLAITNSLEDRGLLERRPSLEDRRTVGLHITPEGEERLALAKAAVVLHEQVLKSALQPGEEEYLIDLLARMGDRLAEAAIQRLDA